jgi:conjugal transfer pilus assembly protein TraF
MVKLIFLFMFLFVDCVTFCEANVSHINTTGWHWYNELNEESESKVEEKRAYAVFQTLSASKQLKVLQSATNELRDKAILSGNVSDIAAYKRAQDLWVKKATVFTIGWEKMLLEYPELNYSLSYSHENRLVPLDYQEHHKKVENAIESLSQHNGLLAFYKNSPSDKLFLKTVKHFSKSHAITVMPVAMQSNLERNRAEVLGVKTTPALVLVNPRSGIHQIVSYGYLSEDELSDRLLKIADHWQADF